MATLFTIGHGTRTTEALLEALRSADVRLLVDVRRFPASRRHPHLARGPLEVALPAAGIEYSWRGDVLGGRRRRVKVASRHPAWRVEGFRNYADWMDGPDFRAALARLEADGERTALAVMCAETVWWRCHRRLIADALTVDGHRVLHIMAPANLQEHRRHPALRVDDDGRPVYDVTEAEAR